MTRSTDALDVPPFRQPDSSTLNVRLLSVDDGKNLGALLNRAYKGTIDDENESLEESWAEGIGTLQGKYGPLIWPASVFAVAGDGVAVSCSVVCESEKYGPLLAFAATDPAYQKRGLAGFLIAKSIESLRGLDVEKVQLVVTAGNDSAISLYRKLGFVEATLDALA